MLYQHGTEGCREKVQALLPHLIQGLVKSSMGCLFFPRDYRRDHGSQLWGQGLLGHSGQLWGSRLLRSAWKE